MSTSVARARFEGRLPPGLRRAGLVHVAVSLPLVAVLGLVVHGRTAYVLAFVLVASGPYTTPAFLATALALRAAHPADRWHWWMWGAALVAIYSTGLGILVGLALGSFGPPAIGLVMIVAVWVLLMGAVAGVVRRRSGGRAISVDVVEWLIFMIAIAAPAILLWGPTVLAPEDRWWTLPAAVSALGMMAGCYWTILLFVRLPGERSCVELMGMAFSLVGLVNYMLQTAQGISGFSLPATPLLLFQALCMSLLLLVPLHAPILRAGGLERLPLQDQVRGAGLAPVVVLLGLPVLAGVTIRQNDRLSWALPFSLGAVMVLLVLAAIRQLLAVRETRRLYALVGRVSDERRDLLAQVIRRIDEDRHAVAAQLHEQAMSAYATFVSYLLASNRSPVGNTSTDVLTEASALVRDDLSRQAEALRQLMLAVGPLEPGAGERRSESLRVPIKAYVDSLYGDRATPTLAIAVAPNLVLDWITETIVLRIVQEALRNVWRHSGARRIEVELGIVDAMVDVRVIDDGVGFDPGAGLYESGIAAMRSFAAFAHGDVRVDSRLGGGTVVRARLGAVGGRERAGVADAVSPGTARSRTYR